MSSSIFEKIDSVSTILQDVKNGFKTRLPGTDYIILPQFFTDIKDYEEFQRLTREIQFYEVDRKMQMPNTKTLFQLKEELHQVLQKINTKTSLQEYYDFDHKEFKRLQDAFWDLYRIDEDDGEIVEAKILNIDRFQAIDYEKNGILGAVFNANLKAVLNKDQDIHISGGYKRKLASLLPKREVMW